MNKMDLLHKRNNIVDGTIRNLFGKTGRCYLITYPNINVKYLLRHKMHTQHKTSEENNVHNFHCIKNAYYIANTTSELKGSSHWKIYNMHLYL